MCATFEQGYTRPTDVTGVVRVSGHNEPLHDAAGAGEREPEALRQQDDAASPRVTVRHAQQQSRQALHVR